MTAKIRIKLKGRNHLIDCPAGDTILQAALRCGLSAPFSCRSGTCATCLAIVREGEVTMLGNSVLSEEEVAQGCILTCQSRPKTDFVAIEYED